MTVLDVINKIYLDTELALEIEAASFQRLLEAYPRPVMFAINARNRLAAYFTFILVCVVIYEMSLADTTLINWIFFALNIINLTFLSNNDGKKATLKHGVRTAKCLLYYSVIVLIGECIFAWQFGVVANADVEGSNDQWLKENFPLVHESGLQLIGLRKYIEVGASSTLEVNLEFFGKKCTSYIVYLLIGLYFSNKYG